MVHTNGFTLINNIDDFSEGTIDTLCNPQMLSK